MRAFFVGDEGNQIEFEGFVAGVIEEFTSLRIKPEEAKGLNLNQSDYKH